jgi:hypothetical protein
MISRSTPEKAMHQEQRTICDIGDFIAKQDKKVITESFWRFDGDLSMHQKRIT